MTDRELLQRALGALNSLTKELLACRDELAERGARPETPHKQKLWDSAFNAYTGMAIPTYEALRARLAQPEKEPVAWRIRCTNPMRDWVLMYRQPSTEEKFSNMEIQPLYTKPHSATHSADSAESFCKPKPMACSVLFPRHAPKHGEDWIIDPSFLLRIYHSIDPDAHYGFIPTMEEIETALLALEVIPSNLYTAPQRREWVSLTEAERLEIIAVGGEAAVLYVTEAKLREKNSG